MKKYIYLSFILIFLITGASAQTYYRITDTSGFQNVGGGHWVGISQRNGATTAKTGFICTDTGPYALNTNNAAYRYSTSGFGQAPEKIRLQVEGVDSGETVAIYINGSFYPVSQSQISPLACNTSLDVVVASTTGLITRTANKAASSYGQVDIALNYSIDSILVLKDGEPGGIVYSIFIANDTIMNPNKNFTDTLLCQGDSLYLGYTVGNKFKFPNTFTAQLSDASGSFASPITIGTRFSDTSGTIACKLPASMIAGNGYKVRLVSNNPVRTSVEYDHTITVGTSYPVVAAVSNNGPGCEGSNVSLTSLGLPSSSIVYTWRGPGGFTSGLQNPTINSVTAASAGYYVVTMSRDGCKVKDSTLVATKPTPAKPTITSNPNFCLNADIYLAASSTTAGVSYSWSGPGGFTSSVQNPIVPFATTAKAGTYSVKAELNGCESDAATIDIAVLPGPTVLMYPSPGDTVCPGTPVVFNVKTNNAGAMPQYQWYKNGVAIMGADSFVYKVPTVDNGDVFMVQVTPDGATSCGSLINSISIPITVLQFQTPAAIVETNIANPWPGVQVDFTATSVNAGDNPAYQWKVNGVAVQGATSMMWGTTTLNNKDNVCVDVTSNYRCATPKMVTACKEVSIATGITAVLNGQLKVYPNPAKDKLFVEGLTAGSEVQLYDMFGRKIVSLSATQNVEALNISSLVKGTYLLNIKEGNGAETQVKVIKD